MNAPKSVLIVGGGTAGWMTACLLAKHWSNTQIQLIESSDIGTIGVGEGSTPYLKYFFQQLGLSESEWMSTCDATYKVGINFAGWTQGNTPKSYFHPFFMPFDVQSGNAFFDAANQRRAGASIDAQPEDFFVAAELVRQGIPPVSDKLPGDIDYGYHFDAGKLGTLLKEYATQRGVIHTVDNITQVDVSGDNIQQLHTQKHGLLEAALFVDCSGFKGLLAKEALKRPFCSFSDTLFNDSAIALPTQHPEKDLSTVLQTESNALSAGWMWRIPLTSRMGNGYVYSSQFTTAENAEQELRQALNIDDSVEARHLKMQVGRLEKHWQGNCVAIGLAQGFIEPLEATALMLVQYAIQQLIDNWSHPKATYNQEMNRMFDGIRDYIAAHYHLSNRTDSDYWNACQHDMVVPDVLKTLLNTWDSDAHFEPALKEVERELVYLKPSWYCILAGMGRFPSTSDSTPQTRLGESAYLQDTVKRYFTMK